MRIGAVAHVFGVLSATYAWQSTVVLGESSLVMLRLPVKGEEGEQDVNVPYAEMASAEIKSMMRRRWVVIRGVDGHVYSFWLATDGAVDGKRTEAAGALLKSRVPVKGSGRA